MSKNSPGKDKRLSTEHDKKTLLLSVYSICKNKMNVFMHDSSIMPSLPPRETSSPDDNTLIHLLPSTAHIVQFSISRDLYLV